VSIAKAAGTLLKELRGLRGFAISWREPYPWREFADRRLRRTHGQRDYHRKTRSLAAVT